MSAHYQIQDDNGECTSLFSEKAGVLAQNWDWAKTMESLFIVLRIVKEDGKKILMLTEPGIIGKIGMNSDGVGTCLNLIYHSETAAKWGGLKRDIFEGTIPIHIMCRAILDAPSLKKAVSTIKGVPRSCATMSHLLVADKSSDWAMLEIGGKVVDVIGGKESKEELPVHTNHFLKCGYAEEKTGGPSSYARYDRCVELHKKKCDTLADVQAVLSDAEGKLPICRPYLPSLELGIKKIGTCCSVAMELASGKLHITLGSPMTVPYTTFDIHTGGEEGEEYVHPE